MIGWKTKRMRLLSGGVAVLALVAKVEAAGPIVVLIGPPGSGKTTQAEILKKERGMPLISADELIARNPESFPKAKSPAGQPENLRLDPALNRLVEEALGKIDLSKGAVLDGYPAAKGQGDFLLVLRDRLGLPKVLVIHLNASDSVVRKRLKKENAPDIEQRLKDYHRELDFARTYFPQADIRDVDAAKKPGDVAKQIRKLIDERLRAGKV